jgi:hypothetical protein
MRESKRYLGLELSGAKNQKTSLAALEFYPKERKIFLLDIYDRITPHDSQSNDQALLDLIDELQPGVAKLGVNVPLELPPCITCSRKTCPLPAECSVPSVKWMRNFNQSLAQSDYHQRKILEFTPYTQRPFELWARYLILPELSPNFHFEIDETLGGNRAPLTARMQFLQRHLHNTPLIEVWPKLSIALLARDLEMDNSIVSNYRTLEEGIHCREEILSQLARGKEIFIYERDMRKLAQSLPAFDAFVCAFTALLSDQMECAKPPKGFPIQSGWIQYPES